MFLSWSILCECLNVSIMEYIMWMFKCFYHGVYYVNVWMFLSWSILCECLNVSVEEYIGVYAKQKHISIYSYNKYYLYNKYYIYRPIKSFIEVPVPSKESVQLCICVLDVSICLFLQIFYWILELLRQCGIFYFFIQLGNCCVTPAQARIFPDSNSPIFLFLDRAACLADKQHIGIL